MQWLDRELALVQPKAVVALGATAAKALGGRPVAVMRERGTWVESITICVDAVMDQAWRAGAHIMKPAQDTFWGGYAGYFQDPDGHL